MPSSEDYCPNCGFMLSRDSKGADFCLVCGYGKNSSATPPFKNSSNNNERKEEEEQRSQQPSSSQTKNSSEFCIYCGAELTEVIGKEATFCPNCGKPLSEDSSAAESEEEESSAPEITLPTPWNTSEIKEEEQVQTEKDQVNFQRNSFSSVPIESLSSEAYYKEVVAPSKTTKYDRKSHAGRNIAIIAILIIVAMIVLILFF